MKNLSIEDIKELAALVGPQVLNIVSFEVSTSVATGRLEVELQHGDRHVKLQFAPNTPYVEALHVAITLLLPEVLCAQKPAEIPEPAVPAAEPEPPVPAAPPTEEKPLTKRERRKRNSKLLSDNLKNDVLSPEEAKLFEAAITSVSADIPLEETQPVNIPEPPVIEVRTEEQQPSLEPEPQPVAGQEQEWRPDDTTQYHLNPENTSVFQEEPHDTSAISANETVLDIPEPANISVPDLGIDNGSKAEEAADDPEPQPPDPMQEMNAVSAQVAALAAGNQSDEQEPTEQSAEKTPCCVICGGALSPERIEACKKMNAPYTHWTCM